MVAQRRRGEAIGLEGAGEEDLVRLERSDVSSSF
jgi:hypothetical protein